jgi:phage tail-like protein
LTAPALPPVAASTRATPRPFAAIATSDQWLRAAYARTTFDPTTAAVELDWSAPAPNQVTGAPPGPAAGLAFDDACRLYRSVPLEGRVERSLWAAIDPLAPAAVQPAPVDLFVPVAPDLVGDFSTPGGAGGPLRRPTGLAVDDRDHLFVAETAAGDVTIFDLWEERLLRRVPMPAAPLDLARSGGKIVYALLAGPPFVVALTAGGGPRPVPLGVAPVAPARLAVAPAGALYLLEGAGTAGAAVMAADGKSAPLAAPYASDLELLSDTRLVVARRPGEDLLVFALGSADPTTPLPPLRARGYDGLGIVRTPDGDVGFWTAAGFREAVAARLAYERTGRVTTFMLDSGAYQTDWGRLFLDACIPPETDVRVHFVTADELSDDAPLPRTPPAKLATTLPGTLVREDLSPPMPPLAAAPAEGEVVLPLHRRESGRELPWSRLVEGDLFTTYEAPVAAPPGRFLWVTLALAGNTRRTPKVRVLRVEYPGHDLLRRLPRVFSREAAAADFLRRYLVPFDGSLGELEGRAAAREVLLNPRATPEELLPWLASFLGLVLDERWSADVRRTAIAEAGWLFRFRGTLPGLKRFIEIYTGFPITILESFRVRGLGGATLGGPSGAPGPSSNAILGAGFRVGGAVGATGESPITGTADDAFRTHAHRFSVFLPGALTPDQLDVVAHILDVHRPAHTIYDLCTVDVGMRVGRGLHLGLSTVIGAGAGFDTLQLGAARLGRDAIVGRPSPAIKLGTSHVGTETRLR